MTNDPCNLVACSSYKGEDKICVDDGAGLSISHARNTILPSHFLIDLQNILFVSEIKKNLLFTSQLIKDDPCMFEFFSSFKIETWT